MKEIDGLFRIGIDAREIRPLVEVALIACECQVGRIVSPAMFLCDNVLDVKRRKGQAFLSELAVLAVIACSLSNHRAQARVHLRIRLSSENASSPGLEHTDEVHGVDIRGVLGALVFGELAFVSQFGQFVDSGLSFRIGSKIDESSGDVGRQAARNGFEQSVKEFCIRNDAHVRIVARAERTTQGCGERTVGPSRETCRYEARTDSP
jgi:hypothetical protein